MWDTAGQERVCLLFMFLLLIINVLKNFLVCRKLFINCIHHSNFTSCIFFVVVIILRFKFPQSQPYLRRSSIVFVMFDLSDKESFLNSESWLQKVYSALHPLPIIVLIGSKLDLERRVSKEDVQVSLKIVVVQNKSI